ncbi:MAG: primosomal protein N' [Chlamydiota bacterium]
MSYTEIALFSCPNQSFDYAIPKDLAVEVGDYVEVPFRKSTASGYVVRKKENSAFAKARPIFACDQKRRLPPELLDLARWMAQYYCTPLSKVVLGMIPSSVTKKVEEKPEIEFYLLQTKESTRQEICQLRTKFPKRGELLERFLQRSTWKASELSQYRSQIATLYKKKWIGKRTLFSIEERMQNQEYFLTTEKQLTEEQATACKSITSGLDRGTFQVFLLHGVTGSGKTELYLQSAKRARALGKDVLVLVPEVALTSQLIEKFRSRFAEPIGVIHHQRSLKEKSADWKKIQEGSLHIVLGARSAVFAPLKNIGLIIVDEEHDSSYKQSEEMPTYHARDIAIKRGSQIGASVVLGSATPSLESYYKATRSKYTLLSLTKRATASSLAPVKIIDMGKEYEKAGGFTHFSAELLEGIKKRRVKGEQTLLFFNRRGYRTARICTKCSKPLCCPFCDLALTLHKKEERLRCHLCHFQMPSPRKCPYCGAVDEAKYQGFGTEHIERSLQALLPEIRTLRMDRDTTRKKGAHEALFRAFRSGKADVLIGTQMIAKGFHFPSVTLVGVLHPEKALFLPDFRAPEFVFQLITQVAGRAGREELSGEVLIQTHLPKDPLLHLAKEQQFLPFYAKEIAGREDFTYPPFSRMIKVVLSSPNPAELRRAAKSLHFSFEKVLREDSVYPITEPHHAKVAGRFRLHILLRTKNIGKTTAHLKALVEALETPRSLRILVDVDCISIL